MTLTEKRRSLDMSLGELAKKCDLKPQALSKIERGMETPDDGVISALANALNWTNAEVTASLPDPKEVEANFSQFSDMMAALSAVQADAKQKGLGRGNGGDGEIECPIDKGRLRYSVAGVNGHIWGKCSNDGCVSWMM